MTPQEKRSEDLGKLLARRLKDSVFVLLIAHPTGGESMMLEVISRIPDEDVEEFVTQFMEYRKQGSHH